MTDAPPPASLGTTISFDAECAPKRFYYHSKDCPAADTAAFNDMGLPLPLSEACNCEPRKEEAFPDPSETAILDISTVMRNGRTQLNVSLAVDPSISVPCVTAREHLGREMDVRLPSEMDLLRCWDAMLRYTGSVAISGYNIANFDLPYMARRYHFSVSGIQ